MSQALALGGTGRRRCSLSGAALLLLLPLAACTTPDWIDPSTWLEEEPQPSGRLTDEAVPEDEAFPNLASVPERAPRATPPAQRTELAKGLLADRTNAYYSNQPLTPEVTAVPPAAPPPAPPQPEIAAAPTTEAAASPAPPSPAPPSPVSAPTPTPPKTVGPIDWNPVPEPAEAATLQTAAPPPGPGESELAGVIFFDSGSTDLDVYDQQVLRGIVALHRQRGAGLRVVGHASSRTAARDAAWGMLVNFRASAERADQVAAALRSMGADGTAIQVVANSDNQLIYQESAPTGEAGNRRVEIFLVY